MVRKNLSCLELYRQTLASNIGCLLEYVQKLIYLYERRGESLSVVLLDVDNMKQINRKGGYGYGNHILLKIAEIISSSIRKSDIAGKYKGSSFLILLPNSDTKGAEKVARRIRNRIEGLELESRISVTIGIYSFVPKGNSAEAVLELVETRVAEAKSRGGDDIVLIQEELPRKSLDHQTLLQVLNKRSLEPAFQPIYNLEKGQVEGYEVLMRLLMEDGRVVPAGCFIEDLLKTSFISLFEEIVLQKAFLRFKAIGLEGRMYINFPYNFVNFIAKGRLKVSDFHKEVISYGLEPSRVVLELSEGKMTGSTEDLVELVKEVRSYGFGVAVDDFGVEYSSVERLIKTKPDVVKLDGFFLREARSMLKWVVVGLKRLGFSVLAEQVEREDELQLVKSLRVDMAQGFYLGKPQIL
ncbi:MAG: bifunctional diguanylate cyclase/phosphodiesterase [Aquificaceae bacterium]|uniref:EAL domain-containing protein n=1 Tax=Hydrogenobacter sp. Uz 6-8 TaxID=3384828 RepID=UPI0030B532AD